MTLHGVLSVEINFDSHADEVFKAFEPAVKQLVETYESEDSRIAWPSVNQLVKMFESGGSGIARPSVKQLVDMFESKNNRATVASSSKSEKACVMELVEVNESRGKTEIENLDRKDRKCTIKIDGNKMSSRYKSIKVAIHVIPKEDGAGSIAYWTVMFEKISSHTEEPRFFVDEAGK